MMKGILTRKERKKESLVCVSRGSIERRDRRGGGGRAMMRRGSSRQREWPGMMVVNECLQESKQRRNQTHFYSVIFYF